MTTPDTTQMTDDEVRDLPVEVLADALLHAGAADDMARRGALHALLGYGDLSLLRLRMIRAYIVAAGTDGPLVQWSVLGRHLAEIEAPRFNPDHLADDDRRRGLLNIRSTTQLDALRLAVALGDTTYATNLRGMAGRFGHAHRPIMVEAIAIAFGITGTITINGATEPGH